MYRDSPQVHRIVGLYIAAVAMVAVTAGALGSVAAAAGPQLQFRRAHGVALGEATTPPPALTDVMIGGANRLLVCAVSIEPRLSATTVTAVVLDDGRGGRTQLLQQLGTYYSAPSDGLKWSTWYLTAPHPGKKRVSVVLSDSVLTSYLACVSYVGVDQANPFGPVSTVSGTAGVASMATLIDQDGSLPWAHVFSANAGYLAGPGVVDRQSTSTHLDFSFSSLVDSGADQPAGSYTFGWDYVGQFGGQSSAIHPAR